MNGYDFVKLYLNEKGIEYSEIKYNFILFHIDNNSFYLDGRVENLRLLMPCLTLKDYPDYLQMEDYLKMCNKLNTICSYQKFFIQAGTIFCRIERETLVLQKYNPCIVDECIIGLRDGEVNVLKLLMEAYEKL